MFSIDIALQTHWSSCCEATDHISVNDKVLIMDDHHQDQILHHSYFQQISKSIQNKIVDPHDFKNLGHESEFPFCKDGLELQKIHDDTETIVKKERSHSHWKLHENLLTDVLFV